MAHLRDPHLRGYAELAAATNFSFLTGASQPAAMVEAALELGQSGLGIADRNSVAGVVRAWRHVRDLREEGGARDFKLISGARLVFADDTPDIIAYPTTRTGWGNLTRLLTVGNLRAKKGECELKFSDLLEWAEDMALIVLPPLHAFVSSCESKNPNAVRAAQWHWSRTKTRRHEEALHHPLSILRNRIPLLWLGATMNRAGRDKRSLVEIKALSAETGIPLIAINDALYAMPEDRPLHDILTCIREKTSIQKAGKLLAANAERHLKSPSEMARLFADAPEAIAATQDLLAAVQFDLSQLSYEYPHEPVPEGWTPDDWLAHIVWEAARARHPEGVPEKLRLTVEKELTFIRAEKFACYFLTVHDLVRFARNQAPPILCQGRGSAANSAVCFLLGVTSVDPMQHDLLFSRFISADRQEPPDIDVDFEHERREEVMQYVYERYGRHRAGIVSTVIHYRPRSAVREVGKALGLTEDVTAQLAGTIWGSWGSAPSEKRLREAGFDPDNPEVARLKALSERILQFPRHLSQHVGGFVLTENRLDETVPIHNAAMKDRTFIEWDKDDIDALGLMKVDVLALGMLTCIHKAYDMIRALGLGDHDLTVDIDSSDPAVYDMLCTGDSVGVFQVESRAQMNMLPRLKPRTLYDLTIQVAIVRPGPIEGDMVHPYLRRRSGREKVSYPAPAPEHGPADELVSVLGKTEGVPLFQEQAMKLAIVAAKFTDSEANQLRRAMATFRNRGGIDKFRDKMVGGMVARGYQAEFAERCFKQIEGFGSYGFPESHALSFARLVYVSAWIKCHYPAVFAAALLNSQPMGFYAPAQIVRDAREHGVEVRGVDVNESGWESGVQKPSPLQGARTENGNGLPPAIQQSSPGGLIDHSHPSRLGEGTVGNTPSSSEKRTAPSPNPSPEGEGDSLTLHLGLHQIDSFREEWANAIIAARPFASVDDLARRANLPKRAMKLLADADALRSLGLDRRDGAWAILRDRVDELPLFAAVKSSEDSGTVLGTVVGVSKMERETVPESSVNGEDLRREPASLLPAMHLGEHIAADYQTVRLSLKGHPLQILRAQLEEEGTLSCAQTNSAKAGARVTVAGVVLIRQRPGKGNAIFVTLEDETGVTNIILWARTFERYRMAVMLARLMQVSGERQQQRRTVHDPVRHEMDNAFRALLR